MKRHFEYKIVIRYFAAISILIFIVLISGCTKKFDELNTDPTTFSSLTPSTIPNAFAKAEYQGIYGDPGIYELARALFPDYWCQFYADGGGAPSDRYVIVQDWIISQWNSVYTITWPTIKQVIEATKNTDPGENAIAKIWKAYIFHYQTDYYGPVPYFQAGTGQLSIPYDSQHDIYYDLFGTLDSAVTTLKGLADTTAHPYGDNDLIYHGDVGRWIKLANTLRLRLALRISFVEPDKAKTEAEKAVSLGVMTSNDDNALMDVQPASPNGLNEMSPWEGFRMSASMESYLKGYTDPRMTVYYSPAANGQYRGLRNGLTSAQLGADSRNSLDSTSNIGVKWALDDEGTNKLTVMYSAEAFFLRAEGALNGWNMGGTAQELYEQGIKTSMQQWSITDNTLIDSYISGTSVPVALNDFLNSPAVATIPVKFSADPETERQQIITQKWIALFPDGIEGWAELRRTGYPKLYPIANSENQDVPKDSVMRRFTFVPYEYQTNGKAVLQTGVPSLNGPDKASTHVWWDVH
ncbi:MAG: SusD/RagB family nutrient-binding outer membrane lipoprotein [Ginsengibacter sp.]